RRCTGSRHTVPWSNRGVLPLLTGNVATDVEKLMYSRLLVPLDGSPTANLALKHAAVWARLSGATVVLLHIIEELKHSRGFERPLVYIREVKPGFLAAGQKLLDEAALGLKQEGLTVETVLLESGGERV